MTGKHDTGWAYTANTSPDVAKIKEDTFFGLIKTAKIYVTLSWKLFNLKETRTLNKLNLCLSMITLCTLEYNHHPLQICQQM